MGPFWLQYKNYGNAHKRTERISVIVKFLAGKVKTIPLFWCSQNDYSLLLSDNCT